MIDPSKVTNFNRTASELEEFLLFTIVVAGKPAYQQAEKLDKFLEHKGEGTPFEYIRWLDAWGTSGYIEKMLRQVKMGQYQRISSAFRGVSDFFRSDSDNIRFHPLATVPVRILESVKGIGMKTSRFFVMHTRPTSEYACLDTHILQWLGNKGHNVPKTTPSGQKYLELEKVFLDYAKEMSMMPAALDLQIWNEAQSKKT
jgi:hypothetical protein